MAYQVTFHGGTGSVTGSSFLVHDEKTRVLVDCGMFQGFGEGKRNSEPFPFEAKEVHALIITHAHLDHIGRTPALVRAGFAGKVYMSGPTFDLAALMLRDSAKIESMNAHKEGREELFSLMDVERFLSLVEVKEVHVAFPLSPTLSATLYHSGHILGSTSVLIQEQGGKSILLTGDVGQNHPLLIHERDCGTLTDAVVIESVYGDRVNPKEHREEDFAREVAAAVKRGGAVIIPAFSIERTQMMLYELEKMMEEGKVPQTPVYLDSPLAIAVTEVYKKWHEYLKPSVAQQMKGDDVFDFPLLTRTKDARDSDKIASAPNPKIIIAGAGMSHGGRVGKHELRYLSDPHSTLMIVGYQAPGTVGRHLQDGVKEVRIAGGKTKVKARVVTLTGWSGHADSEELLTFASCLVPRAKRFFVVQGEPSASRHLAQKLVHELQVEAVVPVSGSTYTI